MADPMTKEEFCARFIDYMVRNAGFAEFDGGQSVREYAEEIAVTYWYDPGQRAEGPEECASADISYWGEE